MKFNPIIKIIIVLSTFICICTSICFLTLEKLDAQKFSFVDQELSENDIVGEWSALYDGTNFDTIIFFPNGTYKQTYIKSSPPKYKYESKINNWYMEFFEDGSIYLYLESGRYYKNGKSYFDNDGWGHSSLYDPFSKRFVEPKNELILIVLYDQSYNLVLYNLWTSPDEGFPLFPKGRDYFIRN